MDPGLRASDQREFARIGVQVRARILPLDAERSEALKRRILEAPSVWTPAGESALRDLAASAASGPAPLLAQAVLELSAQVVKLRSRLTEPAGPVKSVTIVQLSGGGGRFTSTLSFEHGDTFEILLDDEDDIVPPLHALGRIVHRAPGIEGYGFRFEAMHRQDQGHLMRLIYQLQRRALRMAHRDGDPVGSGADLR